MTETPIYSQVAGECGQDDERGFARLPRDWVGVFHYKGWVDPKEDNATADCPHVLDRVMQRAICCGCYC